jgi:multidrug/hemolysin transport system ATP-binding protein
MNPINNIFKKKKKSKKQSDYILTVDNLVKRYGNVNAVNNISFKVKRGGLFAFLGLNGAGKSTTINIICSILRKDEGKIIIDGLDLDDPFANAKSKVGIVFQNSVLDNSLSARENLTIRAGFYNIRGKELKNRLDILCKILDLTSFFDRPVGKLSGGQKRRVDIARAMIHEPSLLILDEPTTGLDPQTRLSVWNLVNDLRQKTGMTVFLTTHYMEEAEKASYVVIMNKGNIIAEGTPTELKNSYSGDYVIIYTNKTDSLENIFTKEDRKFNYNHDNKYYRVTVKDSIDAINFIQNHKDILNDFEVEKGSMDDVFLNVTGVRQILENNNGEQSSN